MLQNSLVSIAMTTHNGAQYLREQLDSIYTQTYENIEVIVCDDKSSDETVSILEVYKKKYGLVYYINDTNLGYVKNFEKVISLCSGEFIALSDQDDIWYPEKIAVLLEHIKDNLLIHSDCDIIDGRSQLIDTNIKGIIDTHSNFGPLAFTNVVTGCTTLVNKDLLNYVLPFPDGLAFHDWWMAIVAAKFDKITYISEALVKYRRHDLQITKSTTNGILSSFIQKNIPFLFFLLRLKKYLFVRNLYTGLLRIYTRFTNTNFPGFKTYQLQINNLDSVKSNKIFNLDEKIILRDAIQYYRDYIKNLVPLKYYYIGLKYSKDINKFKK
jgi:glycosyltransferase involved in cell wall biosynthesis